MKLLTGKDNSFFQIVAILLGLVAGLIIMFFVSIVFADANLKQEIYKHDNDEKVRYKEDSEFVICDDCGDSGNLTIRKLPELSVKFSEEKKTPEILAKAGAGKVIRYQAPETVPFTVYFGYDKDQMPDDEKERLKDLAKMLLEDSYSEFEAVGYTDSKGTKEYNLMLSGRRAETVKALLSSLGGIPSITEGRGKCCTLSSDEDSRRVEIIFKKGGKTQ